MSPSVIDSLRVPIWQAPTSGIAGPELAAAVSKAGGMGSMGLTWTDPSVAAEYVRQVRNETPNPFFANFALAFPPDPLDAVLEAGVPVVAFSWGDPEPYVPKVRAAGASVGIQIANLAGAKRALGLEPDFLICQGVEAGGHVQSTTSLWELLPHILEIAGDVPVIAAGGMSRGQHIAKALDLGAKGAILGTRFIATRESRGHPEYKRLLVESKGETAMTVCFENGWPYSHHRVLRNSTLDGWEAAGCPPVGSRPGEEEAIAAYSDGDPIFRYQSVEPRVGFTGNIEAMCLYSGMGSGEIHDIPPAGELVARLWRECELAREAAKA